MSPTCGCRKTAPRRRPADTSARCHRRAELTTSSPARGIGAERWVGCREEFPSTFPPPDAPRCGTECNGQARPGIAEAVGWPFVHVVGDDRGQVGMAGDPRGAAAGKSPANAYPGSNPGPATTAPTSGHMVTNRAGPATRRVGIPPLSLLRTRRGIGARGRGKQVGGAHWGADRSCCDGMVCGGHGCVVQRSQASAP